MIDDYPWEKNVISFISKVAGFYKEIVCIASKIFCQKEPTVHCKHLGLIKVNQSS